MISGFFLLAQENGLGYKNGMAQVHSVFFEQNGDEEQAPARISVAHYSAEEVIRQFLALYDCMDFKAELAYLGIGAFHFLRRKKALREFRALCIALWGLALQKSFPNDAGNFFAEFREKAPCIAAAREDAQRLHTRVNIYIDLLNPKKDADFSPVAAYFAEVLALDAGDFARLRLKLSLIIRNLYMLIFNKLV